jgi:molybdate-binding protein/transcriptional regulator with XRE-family HTH domain
MSNEPGLEIFVRIRRQARGWSQQALADRAGIARASVSAIEIDRLVPSTAAALALARALDCQVEELFRLPGRGKCDAAWAWPMPIERGRYWLAEVGGRKLLYPYESTQLGTIQHDGVAVGKKLNPCFDTVSPTIVIACCDPAVALLAGELARVAGLRLLAFYRSSRQALALLKQGLVHAAGLHLSHADDDGNIAAVKSELGTDYQLVRVAQWDEGIATTSDRSRSLQSLLRSNARWVGREPGSGARQCLDELLGSRSAPRRLARDHRGVADAVRNGWADAGVCLRLAAEEANLRFILVRQEAYDLCFPNDMESDPAIRALLAALRSANYRRLLKDLPGYQPIGIGTTVRVN